MYGQNGAIHSRLIIIIIIIIIKILSYLLKINKITNKKYICSSNFELRLYCHIYIYESCFLASQ